MSSGLVSHLTMSINKILLFEVQIATSVTSLDKLGSAFPNNLILGVNMSKKKNLSATKHKVCG